MAYSALKWIHGFLPCQHNPLDSALCRNLLEAGKRQRTHPITKKEPVSVDLVADIVRSYAHQSATLKDMRFATMCVLSFAGLFRSKEVLNIIGHTVSWFDDHILISIPQSKTVVYRMGQDVFIARSYSATCPGTILARYLEKANIQSSDNFIFRNVVYLNSLNTYILGKTPLSYSTFRQEFKNCLKKLGRNEKIYGLHSFRAGGATHHCQEFCKS